jgi:2-iminobutanoate/2-iminopropanoate deaminase
MRIPITSPDAAAVGPYSHAVDADPFVFLSGQTPLDPATGKLVEGSIADQTRQVIANLTAVLGAAGLTLEHAQKVNVFLVDMGDFAEMNGVYAEAFTAPYPARSTVAVAALPLGARVEIELVAKRPG